MILENELSLINKYRRSRPIVIAILLSFLALSLTGCGSYQKVSTYYAAISLLLGGIILSGIKLGMLKSTSEEGPNILQMFILSETELFSYLLSGSIFLRQGSTLVYVAPLVISLIVNYIIVRKVTSVLSKLFSVAFFSGLSLIAAIIGLISSLVPY